MSTHTRPFIPIIISPSTGLAFFLILVSTIIGSTTQDFIKEERNTPYWKIEGLVGGLNDSCKDIRSRAAYYLYDNKNDTLLYIWKSKNLTPYGIFELLNNGNTFPLTINHAELFIANVKKFLTDTNPEIRIVTMNILAKLGKQAEPFYYDIAQLLDDDNVRVKCSAVNALNEIGIYSNIITQNIAELLNGTCTEVKINAISALGNAGVYAKKQINTIFAFLQDENINIRKATVQALYKLSKDSNIEILKLNSFVNKSDPVTRSFAIEALGSINALSKADIPTLIILLKDVDPQIRVLTVRAIATMRKESLALAPFILPLLNDKDINVRCQAILTVGTFTKYTKQYIPLLVNLLKVDFASPFAAIALKGSCEEALPLVLPLFKDNDSEVRFKVVENICRSECSGKCAQLLASEIALLLNDPNNLVRMAASSALKELGEDAKNSIPEIIKSLSSENFIVRNNALHTLSELAKFAGEAIPFIVNSLDDQNTFVRVAALDALGNIGKYNRDYSFYISKCIEPMLNDPNSEAREHAIKATINTGVDLSYLIPKISFLIEDSSIVVRRAVIEAMEAAGVNTKSQAPSFAQLLLNPNPNIRTCAFDMLGIIGELDLFIICQVLNALLYYPDSKWHYRFYAHLIAGNNQRNHLFVNLTGDPCKLPHFINSNELINAIQILYNGWNICDSLNLRYLKNEIESCIATLTKQCKGSKEELSCLNIISNQMKNTYIGPLMENQINKFQIRNTYKKYVSVFFILPVHIIFWFILIVVYPKHSAIQAIFFWNPWVRRFVGMGYIGFVLTWVPFLRRRLFYPFKDSLLADAKLDNKEVYYPDSKVVEESTGSVHNICDAIPTIQGQILLQGASGLGKTMFLRKMLKNSNRIAIFLPAEKCANGVMSAIQAKLHGITQQTEFLTNLIYSGALDLYIDGLNEVSADTRKEISAFTEKYSKGNIIITTQVIEWKPPSTVKIYTLQPLTEDKIEEFLLPLETDAAYQIKVKEFLARIFDKCSSDEPYAAYKAVLSNPMDLALVGRLLATGREPDLLCLQKQQYSIMATDYAKFNNGQPFPLQSFSEKVYIVRLYDAYNIPEQGFAKVLICMERHKMVLKKQSKFLTSTGSETTQVEWVFRHDKITDFFIAQTFIGSQNDKTKKHLGDSRFRGVYFLLAQLLPIQDAEGLERILIDYAADSKDHTVSDEFIKLLRQRKDRNG